MYKASRIICLFRLKLYRECESYNILDYISIMKLSIQFFVDNQIGTQK